MAITASLLVSQVRNTAPYVFGEDPESASIRALRPAQIIRSYNPDAPLSHAAYFELCLSAHYLTCATPVPTDVDNQIRKKLWPDDLPLETALEMATFVLESHDWDFVPLGTRVSHGAKGSALEHTPLHGHFGEWFTVAVGAYAALAAYRAPEAQHLRDALLDAIDQETTRHAEIFASVWRAKDGLGALRASVSIAHNFGDLDRVVDMWDLPIADPLRLRFYKLTASAFDSERKLRHQGRLWTAGELYKSIIDGSSMALENHRHFALRKPRALRSHPALRIPVGPFFDAWGRAVATHLEGEALDEVLDALLFGQGKMQKTIGYARGLAGIVAAKPALAERVTAHARQTKNAQLTKLLAISQQEIETRWNDAALAHLDDIPSRA